MRAGRVSWWAWWIAVGAHVLLLVGMRVGVERAPLWVTRRALIWETQPQRMRVTGGAARGGVMVRGAVPTERPVVERFSAELEKLVRRIGGVEVGGGVVFVGGETRQVVSGERRKRAQRELHWRFEAQDGIGVEVLGGLEVRGGAVDARECQPKGPVVLEVVVGAGGELRHVLVKVSSGDEACDREAVEALWKAQKRRAWGKETPQALAVGEGMRGQISATIEAVE